MYNECGDLISKLHSGAQVALNLRPNSVVREPRIYMRGSPTTELGTRWRLKEGMPLTGANSVVRRTTQLALKWHRLRAAGAQAVR